MSIILPDAEGKSMHLKHPVTKPRKGPKGPPKGAVRSPNARLLKGVYTRHPCVAAEAASRIFRTIGSAVSLKLLDAVQNGRFKEVVTTQLNISEYTDASDFRRDYLAVELMSKFPSWDLGIDREAVAIESFLKSEEQCSSSNVRLKRSFGTASTTVSTSSYMYMMKRKIERLLGPFSWDEAEQDFGFGPGASFALKRKNGDTYHKLGCKPEVTRECAALFMTAIRRCSAWHRHVAGLSGEGPDTKMLTIVPGNRITTVPKNAKTNRVIAIEPLGNMFIQKGIGGFIRRRLRRVGVDLNDQTINQKLAREGSLSGSLATIDLSAASDTVSLEVCRQLLPPDLYEAVELARSPSGVLPDGSLISYQKVSSMGNGFTFELESLIFWAATQVIVDIHAGSERRVAIYGDDIICPADCYVPLEGLLNHLGFNLNAKKSYSSGPFRESCGKHYFNGHDVTPIYIREDVDSFLPLVLLSNNLRRFASRGSVWGLDNAYKPIYDWLNSHLPDFWRVPRIPDGFGDVALFGDFDEVKPARAPRGWEGYMGLGVAEQSTTSTADDVPYLLKALWSLDRKPCLRLGSSNSEIRMSAAEVPFTRFIVNGFKISVCRAVAQAVQGAESFSVLPYKVTTRRPKLRIVKFVAPRWENIGPWA